MNEKKIKISLLLLNCTGNFAIIIKYIKENERDSD